jgi:hypothetical protein
MTEGQLDTQLAFARPPCTRRSQSPPQYRRELLVAERPPINSSHRCVPTETPGFDDPLRAALAQRIIALVQGGEHDPERLCEGALRAASPAVPPGLPSRPEGGQAGET